MFQLTQGFPQGVKKVATASVMTWRELTQQLHFCSNAVVLGAVRGATIATTGCSWIMDPKGTSGQNFPRHFLGGKLMTNSMVL